MAHNECSTFQSGKHIIIVSNDILLKSLLTKEKMKDFLSEKT